MLPLTPFGVWLLRGRAGDGDVLSRARDGDLLLRDLEWRLERPERYRERLFLELESLEDFLDRLERDLAMCLEVWKWQGPAEGN